jgi:hypothetical protein
MKKYNMPYREITYEEVDLCGLKWGAVLGNCKRGDEAFFFFFFFVATTGTECL